MKRALLLTLLLLGTASAERVYRVQPGDTLWKLAQQNGVTVAALQRMNDLPGQLLEVGQVLKLPGGTDTARVVNEEAPVFQRGSAVYYGGRGNSQTSMTAAHLSLPFGTWVRVTHANTGRSVDVMINDRGPFGVPSRIIDLSNEAAAVLGILSQGVAPVTLTILSRP
ncbi:LysM peptidoglycan-binding domain-containing protein [Deinococcus sp. Arct2-2]|uniref:septal ring lytic transglycosylase RlpA family protein n=1 Tax=Deinococcus sp. Arct2-2 TaxID=2568653 RepID=UPI0010A4E193|nr:RlpA-like double-psi beta-barrel domain-containing protein [Deinococcus sp. Arct2-2]THF70037.1 LysM peptidoglycan-binding domain-containing protein [Deinococcus sp. Arct2-2]